jgi:glycosyltransferase involved in cell wall biosynthesis
MPVKAGTGLRVLLVSTMRTSFIQEDIDTLGRQFSLELSLEQRPGAAFAALRRAMRADVTVCWFASVYSFFAVVGARLAGRRSVIMLGGVDTAKEPAMNYGLWLSPWKGLLVRYALRHASAVTAVDMSLKESLRQASGWDGDSIRYLPTGYDPGLWKPAGAKEDLVLAVAVCDSRERMEVKGIDTLLAAATLLPEVQFRVIGMAPALIAELAHTLPGNVELLPPIPRADLLRYYRQARVFCQPSRREGLPNTLCEAMLCECIPVGTRVGGIPTAIDGYGFLAPPDDAAALGDAIRSALGAPLSLGGEGRQHIATTFPKERRERDLVAMIEGLANA